VSVTVSAWNRLRFLWHYRRNRLALALARRDGSDVVSTRTLWAMYRLSLFRSVASARVKNEGWQTAFAQAVSHAACGNPEDARHALLAYQASAQADEHAAELAEALAPFMPREALQLLNGRERLSRALAVALLLRNGEHEHAQGLLGALPVEALRACPDLWLLQTNAFGGVPAEQLDRLNAYLAAHGLSPVRRWPLNRCWRRATATWSSSWWTMPAATKRLPWWRP
jgi:hypothetical protein